MNTDTTSTPGIDDDTEEGGLDAISLLEADHREVSQLFAEYEQLIADEASEDEREVLAHQICHALTAHATAEEELFYPAAREATGEDELLDEAEAEHAQAKELIAQILAMDPSDEAYDSTVRALQEAIDEHVHEEEGQLFPRVEETSLDLERLGEQIAQRKEEVLASLEDGAD